MMLLNTKTKIKKDYIFVLNSSSFSDVLFYRKIVHHLSHNKNATILWIMPNELAIKSASSLGIIEHCYIFGEDIEINKIVNSIYSGYIIKNSPIYLDFSFDKSHCPIAKYEYINADYEDWVNYVDLKRSKDREDILYYDLLGLRDNTEYGFICDIYDDNICDKMKELIPSIPCIKYESLGFSYVDWCKVIENAQQIHSVECSIFHLVELVSTNARLFAYPRNDSLYLWKKLFKKPWNFFINELPSD